MTILFHPNIRNLMIGRGILAGGLTSACGITIYSGIQPTAAAIAADWATYNSLNAKFLAHFTGAIWSHPLSGTTTFCSITTFPPATPATNTGTGSWCILWMTNPTGTQLSSTTLPSTQFIIGPVSNLTGNGIVRFSTDTNFTIGVSRTIGDGTIGATST